MKLIVQETESDALTAYVDEHIAAIATSRLALVEVPRATSLANPDPEVERETARLLDSCLLIEVTDRLLRAAARLTSREVRTLDAIHLASAQRVDADEILVYDRRLAKAAEGLRMTVVHPGREG